MIERAARAAALALIAVASLAGCREYPPGVNAELMEKRKAAQGQFLDHCISMNGYVEREPFGGSYVCLVDGRVRDRYSTTTN